MAMKKFRKPLIIVVVALLSILTIMVLLDVVFRIYESRAFIKEVDQGAAVFDLAQYSYNDHGPPVAREEAPGEFRILSIGDSYVQATTRPKYTYSAVLENELNRLGTGKRVRVVNLGVGGVSFPEYMADYLFWSKILRFDAVVFNIYLGNNFTKVEATPYDPARIEHDTLKTGIGASLPHEYPFRFLDYAFGIAEARHYFKAGDDYYNPTYQLPWDEYLVSMVRTSRIYNPAELPGLAGGLVWAGEFMAFVKRLEDAGIKVAVVASPPHLFYNAKLLRDTEDLAGLKPGDLDPALALHIVSELARRRGVSGEIIDVAPCLSRHADQGEDLYYGTDTHWSVAGNKVVGQYLADVLAARWLGVSGQAVSDCPGTASAAQVKPRSQEILDGLFARLGL